MTAENDLGVVVDEKLHMSGLQCVLTALFMRLVQRSFAQQRCFTATGSLLHLSALFIIFY